MIYIAKKEIGVSQINPQPTGDGNQLIPLFKTIPAGGEFEAVSETKLFFGSGIPITMLVNAQNEAINKEDTYPKNPTPKPIIDYSLPKNDKSHQLISLVSFFVVAALVIKILK